MTTGGIEHVRGLPWGPDSVVIVEGSAVAMAAAAHGLRDVVAAGTVVTRPAAIVDRGLAIRAAEMSITAVEGDGLPSLSEPQTWPLEAE